VTKTRNLLAALVLSIFVLGCDDKTRSPDQSAPPPIAVDIITIKPTEQAILVQLPGRSQANKISEVRPQIGGIIESVNFKEGGKVTAGDSLYTIRSDIYQAELTSANANLESATASMNTAFNEYNRQKLLLTKSVTSKKDYDSALLNYKKAQANVDVQKANVNRAQIQLAYTQVKAPISGIIGESYFTEGALVQVNQAQPLAIIQQIDPIKVTMSQSSDEFLKFKREIASGKLKLNKNATVDIVLSDGTPYMEKGVLLFSDIFVDQNTGTVHLKAKFDNADKNILPGMFVHTLLNVGTDPKAILVPQKAVFFDSQSRPAVYIVNDASEAEQRVISVAQSFNNHWRVTSGLKENDKVIVNGLVKIRPGSKVIISELPKNTATIEKEEAK